MVRAGDAAVGADEAAAESTPAGGNGRPWYRRVVREELGVTAAVVVLVAVVGSARPGFLAPANLLSVAEGSVYVGLMAAGMVFALAMREVDLSVGGNYALCVVAGAVLIRAGLNPWLALPLTLALATLVGVANGAVTAYLGLPSFIVTLASALLCRGIGLALADGKQITDLPADSSFFVVVGGSVLGVPTAIWVIIACALVLTVVFTRTRFGVRVRAIGSNPDAAAFSGLPVARMRVAAMGVTGLAAGIAAALSLAFYVAGDPTIGNGYELTAIAACIIGGTPLAGGRGSVPGAVVGNLLLSTVAASLVFFRVPINWTTFATGAVILVAVGFDALLRRVRRRTGGRKGGGPG
ncbi:ABC transporter permease [Pseudonocardia acaciae]|uniref:ABC transporter permease n=1 Tax=Pseudonocardia acaciae TaxID=551276 RepID=UPI0006867C24|nr:ABC transporter permease [Pseudonocardia acaciae]